MGMAAILVMCSGYFRQLLYISTFQCLHRKYSLDWSGAFKEIDILTLLSLKRYKPIGRDPLIFYQLSTFDKMFSLRNMFSPPVHTFFLPTKWKHELNILWATHGKSRKQSYDTASYSGTANRVSILAGFFFFFFFFAFKANENILKVFLHC